MREIAEAGKTDRETERERERERDRWTQILVSLFMTTQTKII